MQISGNFQTGLGGEGQEKEGVKVKKKKNNK